MTLGKAPSVLWTIPVELMFYVYLPVVLALDIAGDAIALGRRSACLRVSRLVRRDRFRAA